jgi:short-subunit dehydrogenase
MKMASEGGLAVITGAAGGLGAAYADELASRGHRLLLIDRRQAPLEQVCQAITARHGTHSEACAVDLCSREDVLRLGKRLEQTPDINWLVNNAGFGALDYFVDVDTQRLVSMADLHVIAPTILTRAVLPQMLEHNRGTIVNVSSLGAFFQSAGNAHYGPTKRYLATFSMALEQELRGTKVRVQALCPGYVRTDFHATDSMKGHGEFATSADLWMSPEQVVQFSMRKLAGKQVVVIPGMRYSILGRFAQMPLLQPMFQWFARRPRRKVSEQSDEACATSAYSVAKSA